MRKTFRFAAIGAVVILLQPCIALAGHDMTCHHPNGFGKAEWNYVIVDPKTEEEELNLLVPGAGGATSTSCSDAGGRALPILPPPDSFSAIELVPGAGQPGRYWLFEPVSQAFLEAHIRLSAELPNFTQPDGRPLLTQYNETGLDFLLQAARDFETGESLSASGGEILAWPAATLREMPAAFDPDELFPPDPARFPLYSGMAQVADIASFTVVPPSQASDPPLPIRMNSTGNGLFYGFDVEIGLQDTTFHPSMSARAQNGLRPVTVNAYVNPNGTSPADVEFNATWVQDDDSSFPFASHFLYSEGLFANDLAGSKAMRPVSLSGYRTSNDATTFTVGWLRDGNDSPAMPWDLVVDETSANYQTAVENLADSGYRPICVSGYSYHGNDPRFSAIFVKDGLTGADWITSHWIPENGYQEWIDGWWGHGFRPISLSAFDVNGQTAFTAVMIRDNSGSKWVARHGLTAEEFNAENANWTSAGNDSGVIFRPLVVAAYRSHSDGGQKRYAAVWRSSPVRKYAVTGVEVPSLSAFDDAMEAFMKNNDINAGSIAVSRNGCIQLHRGYTWAPAGFPVTQPGSRFRIASSSKALTATAVMKLFETPTLVGRKGGGLMPLDLDTRFFDIVGMPDVPPDYGPDASLITIRHLLQHRTGWCSFGCGTSYFALSMDSEISSAMGIPLPLTRQNRFDFMMSPGAWPAPGDLTSVGYSGIPGGQWGYSNFGFSLLSELIDQISGQTYEEFVREEVLIPAGAAKTRLGQTERLLAYQNPREVIYSADQAYVVDANATTDASVETRVGGLPSDPTGPYGRFNINTIDGTGGWVSTTDDMVRFLSSFDAYDPAVAGTDAEVLDWASMWDMWSNPAHSSAALGAQYMLGWQTATVCGPGGTVTARYHGGNVDGSLSIICQRSDGISFAAVFSRNQGGGIWTTLNNVACNIANWPICSPDPVISGVPTQDIPACTGSHVVPVSVQDDATPAEDLVLTASTSDHRLISGIIVGGQGSERTVEIIPVPGQSGSASVRLQVLDGDGRMTSRSFEVNISTTPALPGCPDDVEVVVCEAIGGRVVYDIPRGPLGTSTVCIPPPGSVFPVGATTVVCVVSDECGNQNTCTFQVNVDLDLVPPVIRCPDDIVVETGLAGGVEVVYPRPFVSDNVDQNVSVTCVPPAGLFPPGITTVRCVAEDDCGNRTECWFDVDVRVDLVPPVIWGPSNIVAAAATHRGARVEFEISAYDAADGVVPVSCFWESGDVFPLGTTEVACWAADKVGNHASFLFKVIVTRPRLEISRDERDGLVIDWTAHDAILQEAESVLGPWRPVLKANPPYRVPTDGAIRLYRLAPDLGLGPDSTFSMDQFEQNIRAALNDECVGYSYAINRDGMLERTYASGDARTAADPPQLDMSHTKRINVASVSKTITAVAVLNLLEDMPGVDVDSSVAPYLPPGWVQGPGVATLTFRDLLTHKSGLPGESTAFDNLKAYIEQGIGPKVSDYKNSNYALFRVMIPYMWGIVPWAGNATLEEITAEIYQFYVQEEIFAPMGINDAWLKPTDANPMLMYRFPHDGTAGYDPGDYLLNGGPWGWNLSALDLAAFLAHLRYGTILKEQTQAQMYDERLGWASSMSGDFGEYLAHRGGLRFSPQPYRGVRTCIMDYQNGVQVSLIINSRSEADPNPLTILRDAFDDAWE